MNRSWVYAVGGAVVLAGALALHSLRRTDVDPGNGTPDAEAPAKNGRSAAHPAGGWIGHREGGITAPQAVRAGDHPRRELRGRASVDGTNTQLEQLTDPEDDTATDSPGAPTTGHAPGGGTSPQAAGGAGIMASQHPPTSDAVDPAAEQAGISFSSHPKETFATDQLTVVSNGKNFTGAAGSISFWVEPNWNGNDENSDYLVRMMGSGNDANQVQVFKNLRYLRFLLRDSQGQEHDVGMAIDAWQPGVRHYVAATWGDGLQGLYVDGGLAKQQELTGQLDVAPGSPLYIGSNAPDSGTVQGTDGRVGNLTVHNRILSPDEIANQMADTSSTDSAP